MEKVKIQAITRHDPQWNRTMDFSRNCSWKAGPSLSEKMKQHQFLPWERVFIAENGEQIIGFCTLTQTDGIPDLNLSPFIGYLFVDEAFRGSRISQRLITSSMGYAEDLGFKKVFLLSREEGLYEKYGFIRIQKVFDGHGDYEQLFSISL